MVSLLRRFRRASALEALNELLAELRDLQRSARHINGLRGDLARFVAEYPDMKRWTPGEIGQYLRGLSVGPRRRDNIRDSIVTLSRFARRNGRLPEGELSAAEKVRKIKPGHEVTTWSPAETELLLEHVSSHWLACLAIGLFAGLRKSEILRLDWSAFKWEMLDRNNQPAPVIAVTRKIARKIRVDRLVPILPNLMTWLEPHRNRVGPVYPGDFKTNENACGREMARIRRATGLPRKDNASRHSFGSYRLALVKNYEQVALEMGNSARKVRENYNDPKPESEAVRYFNLARPAFEKVVPMPLALEFR
jgi:integrase